MTMKTTMSRLALFLCAITLVSCTRAAPGPTVGLTPLQKVAKGLDALSVAIGSAEDSVAAASAQGLISNASANAIMAACQKVGTAGIAADLIVRNATALDSLTVGRLLNIIGPAVASLTPDPNVSKDVQIAVLAAQTALNSVQILIAGNS